MYRTSIKDNEGMLFLFPFNHHWKIWMLNMRFPIDTIWLDRRCRAVHIERSMNPCKNIFSCKTYFSDKPARYIIELKSGTATKSMIRIGDKISLQLKSIK